MGQEGRPAKGCSEPGVPTSTMMPAKLRPSEMAKCCHRQRGGQKYARMLGWTRGSLACPEGPLVGNKFLTSLYWLLVEKRKKTSLRCMSSWKMGLGPQFSSHIRLPRGLSPVDGQRASSQVCAVRGAGWRGVPTAGSETARVAKGKAKSLCPQPPSLPFCYITSQLC